MVLIFTGLVKTQVKFVGKISFCEIWHFFKICFLGLLWEIFFVVIKYITNYIFSPWNGQKRMQYALNYSGTRILSNENKITQFPNGFRLKLLQ